MKFFKQFIILSLTISFIGGCSSANIQAIKSPAHETASKITVYRPDVMAAMGNDMIVAINDTEIAILQNNQYLSVLVPSGDHKVSVRGTAGLESEVMIKTKPLTDTYFEAAGSGNNAVNFIPGSVLLKANFYIEQSESFNPENYNEIFVNYK